MKTSAVIPTKNRPEDLLNATRSIYEQDHLPDELIIVDQSESSESKDKILKYVEGLESKIYLNYVHDPSIAGLIDARKYAAKVNKNDIIMFFEDDVILEKEYIGNMLLGFKEKPNMMGASGIMSNYRPSLFYRIVFHFFHRGIFYDTRLSYHGRNENVPKYIKSNYINGGLSAYRKEVLDTVPFDTKNDFFMYEDIEYSVRACRKFGADNFYINTQARLQHLFSPLNRNKLFPFYERKAKESICFYKKNKKTSFFGLDVLWLFIGFLTEACAKSLKIRSIAPLHGIFLGSIKGIKHKIKV